MKTTLAREHDLLVRYFLGELSPDEQEEVEDRYIFDHSNGELRDEVEMNLVDAYVADTLTAQQRERFEQWYLITPERRESVRTAYLMKTYRERIAVVKPKQSWWHSSVLPPMLKQWLVPALAALGVVAVIGGISVVPELRKIVFLKGLVETPQAPPAPPGGPIAQHAGLPVDLIYVGQPIDDVISILGQPIVVRYPKGELPAWVSKLIGSKKIPVKVLNYSTKEKSTDSTGNEITTCSFNDLTVAVVDGRVTEVNGSSNSLPTAPLHRLASPATHPNR